MLKFGNKEFRNLQEQVLANMRNIANIKEGTAVLSEFGIKVVGEVDTLQELPTVTEYKAAHEDWEYGDAFAIGTEAPYTLVILTRENDEITADHWFDIGQFPAPGPQGAQGPQGEIGPQGPQGNTGDTGADAGFGSVLAAAQTLPAGSQATVTVTASGPNTAKEFSFTFGIPRGADGGSPVWGNIQGTLSDQTDLKNALDAKQDELVSGTNIKTVNNQSVLGSGNIEINSGVWGNITGTLSDQTDLKNALDAKQDVIDASHKLSASYVSGLATVATTGAYADLDGKPTIGTGTITIKKNGDTIDSFGLNQTSDQNINITVPTKTSDLSNDSGFITNNTDGLVNYTKTTSLAAVALSNDYDDLTDKPDLSVYELSADLATVAESGSYTDLSNKPDLSIYAETADLGTAAFINEDALSIGASQVTGLASVATSGDYTDLINKPTIPSNYITTDSVQTGLSGQKTWSSEFTQGSYQITSTLALSKPNNQSHLTLELQSVDSTGQALDNSARLSDSSLLIKNNVAGKTVNYGLRDILMSTPTSAYGLTIPEKNGTLAITTDIGSGTLTIQRNGTTLTTFSANATQNATIDISVPTNSDYVDLTTAQTITGVKTFDGSSSSSAIVPLKINYDSNNAEFIDIYDYEEDCHTKLDTKATSNVSIHLPASTGTLALTSQIPTVVSSLTNDAGYITSSALSGYVPTSTTVNNKALSGNISLTASDVGAVASVTPTTETWTFTLSDGTTTTKTIVTGITVA